MANDGERPPTAAEKGKGKVDDANDLKGDNKEDEVMKDADGKPLTNGKKGTEPKQGAWVTERAFSPWHEAAPLDELGTPTEWKGADTMANILEELNEEDQQLKTELEMLVERLQVRSVLKPHRCYID